MPFGKRKGTRYRPFLTAPFCCTQPHERAATLDGLDHRRAIGGMTLLAVAGALQQHPIPGGRCCCSCDPGVSSRLARKPHSFLNDANVLPITVHLFSPSPSEQIRPPADHFTPASPPPAEEPPSPPLTLLLVRRRPGHLVTIVAGHRAPRRALAHPQLPHQRDTRMRACVRVWEGKRTKRECVCAHTRMCVRLCVALL